MKKSKILSCLLAIAMLMSFVPQAMVSAANDSNVIWSEDFSTGNTYGGENASIVDGALKAGTGAGNGGFNFDTLNAAVADAPADQVRVKFDIKANGEWGSKAKAELKTNTSNVFLIDFGQYNMLRPSDGNATYNGASFKGNVWYTSDIVLDFANNKLIINVAERESGNAILTDFEYAYDLSAVTTIKGIDVYGWGCVNDTYYDNFVIEYVEAEIEEPEDTSVIWSEDFSTGNTYGGENASIVDGALKAGTGAGNGGFNFATLDAAVADAPEGKVRVKWDMKASCDDIYSMAKVELKTNTDTVKLIAYGAYNQVFPKNDIWGDKYTTKNFAAGSWYTNDIVLDFDNNKLIINMTERDSGTEVISNLEWAYDLSAVTTIKGIDAYGWNCTADTYYDNFVIEYVETEEPGIPVEPEFEALIWSEDFSTGNTYGGENASIVDGALKAGTGTGNGGFNFATLDAAVADAPLDQIRVKFDIKANGAGGSRAKAELKTNTNNVFLIDFGQYNMLRPSDGNESYNHVSFSGNVWYTSDIVLDFANNKLIINVAERDSGNAILTDFEYAYDLSAVTTIKGIDIYGWGCANDTYWDNFVIEYVEEAEEPEIPVEPEFEALIWSEDFSTGNTYGGENASIVDGTLKAGTGSGNGGFNFATLDAAVADAPLDQVRVKFDIKANGAGGSRAKAELKTNTSNVFLIDFGQYNFLRPSDGNYSYNDVSFSGNVWYTSDIILDFANNKLIINVAERDSGNSILTDFEYAYDLSGVTTIKGIDIYGWGCANDTYYDNFVIEYLEEAYAPEIPVFETAIWSEDFSGDLSGYSVTTGEIADGEFKTNSGTGTGGFNFATLNAAVADAPEGKVRVKFDIKANGAGDFPAAKAELKTNGNNVKLINYGAWNGINNTPGGDSYGASWTSDVWYTNDIIVDFANNKLIINVEERDSGTVVLANYEYSVDLSGITTVKGLDIYGWNCSTDTYYDNFVIEYVLNVPTVDSESISIYTNGQEEYIASVTPGANKIVIDFGAAIAEATLEDAITFINVTDDETVEFEGTLSLTKYEMEFDGLLPNKTYKLTISGDIENIIGDALGAEYVLNFTTTNGSFKASFAGLTQNSVAIEDFADLTTGEATVSIDFEKTTPDKKTVKLIYAFYNGNKQKAAVVHDITVDADEIEGTKTDSVTIESLEGITSVKVMLWEDLINIKPLCVEIDL